MIDKDKRDKIVKLILIIIIILLLIHNCTLIKKKGKSKTPSGNVNIIEITCEDNNKCDIEPNNNNTNDKNNNIDDNKTTDNNKKNDTNKKDNKNNATNNTNNTNNYNSSNNTDNNQTNTDDETPDDTVVEPENEMFVRDNKLVWNDVSELKIFTNSVYVMEGRIAPESSNTYQFVVKNSTSYNLKYNISFDETNPYNINMKYKLKKNNTYIISDYVTYDQLNVSEQLINAKTNDTYYLEWKWFSASNDNDAGKNAADYEMKIKVEAESI